MRIKCLIHAKGRGQQPAPGEQQEAFSKARPWAASGEGQVGRVAPEAELVLGAGRPAARRGEHPPACFRTGGVPTVWVPLCPGSRQTPGWGHCPSTRRVWCVGTGRPRPRGGRHAVLGRWVHAVWRDLPRHPQPPPAARGPHWFRPLPGWGGLEAGELPLPGKATSDPAGEPQIGLDERRCVQRSVARGLRLLAAPPGSAGLPGRRVCEAFALVTKMRWRWTSRPRARPLPGTRGGHTQEGGQQAAAQAQCPRGHGPDRAGSTQKDGVT